MAVSDWFSVVFAMMVWFAALGFWQSYRIFKLERHLGIRDSRGHLVKPPPCGLGECDDAPRTRR